MRRTWTAIGCFLLAGIGGFIGCGGETGGTSSQSTSTGSASGGAGGQGGGGLGGEGGGLVTGCPSGIVCGSGECCAAGAECVINACLPACASNVRCGEDGAVCCAAGEACVGDKCAKPNGSCLDWADCAEGEFCEPILGVCLPQPQAGSPTCEYKPPTGQLTPVLEWSWTGSTIFPTNNQVINMPVVVDLEKDGTPDVVIVTSDSFTATNPCYLRALNGKDGIEKWAASVDVYKDAYRVQPRVTPAAADIDGDGFVEIVTGKGDGGLIAFEHDGKYKWSSTNADGTPWNTALESATVAIADIEGDGKPEIVVGGVVFDATGKLRFNGGALFGANSSTYGAVSIIADVDGKMPQEIVGGRSALRADGSVLRDNKLTDGYPAIGDLDQDGTPELVVVANGTVRIQNPATGALLAQVAMPGSGAGGPPTIADFDADGVPEIAAANGTAYSVFEYTSKPAPELAVKWQKTTQDGSSNRTGSSVFDFQGDGVAEVVYNDECYFRVYTGTDGSELYKVPNSSATIHEYPVVADVDGDNNTEVILAANDMNHLNGTLNCNYGAGVKPRHGVFLYGDAEDKWVRTRRIWNQHAYHITNVNSDGSVPSPEPASWIAPQGLNNYRQSNQGAGVFNAPDLQVSLEASLANCPAKVALRAFVQNKGTIGVAPGAKVRFYRGDAPPSGTFIAEAVTTKALLPGQYELVTVDYNVMPQETVMSFYVEVDKDDMDQGNLNECLEDNNTAQLGGVLCKGVN